MAKQPGHTAALRAPITLTAQVCPCGMGGLSTRSATRVLYTDAGSNGWGALLARVQGHQYGSALLRMSSSWDRIDSVRRGRC